jgi:hypothetical protein
LPLPLPPLPPCATVVRAIPAVVELLY